MVNFIHSYLKLFSLLFLTFLFYTSLKSQIIDCSTTHQSGVFHVYLDELYASSNTFTSEKDVKEFMGKVQFMLSGVAEGVSTELLSITPCFVSFCEKRKPKDESDFNDPLVEKMHDNDVILEIWGKLEKDSGPDGSNVNRAIINYLLVPVWINTNELPERPGIQKVVYSSGDTTNSVTHLELLSDAPQMRIFIEAGVGINYLLNEEYDYAREFVCSALMRMRNYVKNKKEIGPVSREQALIEYLQNVSKDIIHQAKNDPNYFGSLKLQEDSTECKCLDEGGSQ